MSSTPKLPQQTSSPGAAAASPASSVLVSNPLLARYLVALQANPLRTKQITSGVLSALAEILAGHLAGLSSSSSSRSGSGGAKGSSGKDDGLLGLLSTSLTTLGINQRAIKMFLYGSLVSAPLGHVLTGALQGAFAGKTTPKDKIAQIVVSSLTVTVITNVVYLASMAVVNGAMAPEKIMAVVKAGIWKMLQISWATSPIAIALAQNYLSPELWEPFFTTIRFFLSTYFNTMAKKKQVALARQEAMAKARGAGAGAGATEGEKQQGDVEIRNKATAGGK